MEAIKIMKLSSLELTGMVKSKKYSKQFNRIDIIIDSIGVDYYIQARPNTFNQMKSIVEGEAVRLHVRNRMRTLKNGANSTHFNNLILERCQKL